MSRSSRVGFVASAGLLWLAVLATAITRARLGPAVVEDAALADVWRVLGGAPPVDHGALWPWTLAAIGQHVSFEGLIFARWLALGSTTWAATVGVAWLSARTYAARLVALWAIMLAALISAADAAPWMLASLAIALSLGDRRGGPRYATAAWVGATVLEPALLVPAVISIELIAVLRAPSAGSLTSAKDALFALGALAVTWAVCGVMSPDSLGALADLTGRGLVPAAAPSPSAGIGLAAVFSLVGLGAARAGAPAALAFGGAVPFLTLGLLRGEPTDVLLGALPAVSALTAATTRAYPRRFALFTTAGLAVVLALAGFMPLVGARTAWSPRQLAGLSAPPRPVAAPRAGCEHAPAELVGQRGASVFPRPIAASRCPAAVWPLASPRRGPTGAAIAFASGDLLAWAERYAATGPIGFDRVAGRLREPPVYRTSTPLPVEPNEHVIGVARPVVIRLGRAVSAEHVVEMTARVRAGRVDAALGRLPRVYAQLLDGARPVGAEFAVPLGAALGRPGELVLPVDPARAEWRWVAGRSDPDAPRADRVRLRLRPGPIAEVRIEVLGARELAPPPPAATDAECVSRAPLEVPPEAVHGAARPRAEGASIALREAAPELALGFAPCPGACLLGEAELSPASREDHARLEAEVRAGPRVLDRFARELSREWRRPFEVPLDGATGARFVARGPVDIHGLRIAPCVSTVSVIHAMHSGRHEIIRGEVALSGDTLRFPIAPLGTPAPEVRVPIAVPARACFAMDLRAEGVDADVAVVVGVIEPDASVYRVHRQVLPPGDEALQRLKDIDLTPWAGRRVSLYLAAWALDATDGGAVIEVLRPRVHRCGGPARWAF